MRPHWAGKPSVAVWSLSALCSASVRKVGTALWMRGTLHSAALHASPLRDPWPGELWCFDGSCHGSMTEENIDVLLVWRRFVQDWSRFRLRSGDMDQLYGATLLPFGALCLVFLWESAASSIRTTLSVDTSRWVWRSAGWGIGHLFKGCWCFWIMTHNPVF